MVGKASAVIIVTDAPMMPVYGGYCFLNNAAIAAQYLRDHGAERVAILDIDFHHGNGTQDIF